jgi:D-beta-D-heptose 7-phosphate kinase/D-beta-D-heptose 1-phosphate adenosyltransferase
MVDRYIFGDVNRISPEAPVMVLRETRVDHRPGGAANVAFNLKALGAEVAVVGVAGDDEPGRRLAEAYDEYDIPGSVIITDPTRPTTTKTRFLADRAHQVLRWDSEVTTPIEGETSRQVAEAVARLAPLADLVLYSDYQKGVITDAIVEASHGAQRRIANAKPRTVDLYRGFDLVTLNRPESVELVGRAFTKEESPSVASSIADQFGLSDAVVTLSGDGMANRAVWVPARPVDVFDAAGAGDTTVAALALYLTAFGHLDRRGLELASYASAAVVRKSGVATPDEQDLAEIDRVFSLSVK